MYNQETKKNYILTGAKMKHSKSFLEITFYIFSTEELYLILVLISLFK